MGRTARPFLLGDSAVLPSVFLGKTLNLIFYLQQLLPPLLTWILYTFGLVYYPIKTAGSESARCTFSKISTSSFITPWSSETAVATLSPQVQEISDAAAAKRHRTQTPPQRHPSSRHK
jgi:hypothetical protein